jgi:mannobiose 2-epimerase
MVRSCFGLKRLTRLRTRLPPHIASAQHDAGANISPAQIARQMTQALDQELDAFYSRTLDRTHGGFTADFDENWNRLNRQTKMIVFQARMTWVGAEAAQGRADDAGRFLAMAAHGLQYLAGTMWDESRGGFYWQLDEQGRLTGDLPQIKHTYGQAFAIYAAAAAVRVLPADSGALDLAIRAYHWVEANARDPQFGGYFDALSLDGQPLLTRPPAHRGPRDVIGTAWGCKSANTHLHLLEAYTALYAVWPDPTLRHCLRQLFQRLHDTMVNQAGYLTLFFKHNWRAIPSRCSFGHDVEAAYLLVEAAQLLNETSLISDAWLIAQRLDDHALHYGLDEKFGGLYDNDGAFGRGKTKIWWVQAEALNSFLMMHRQFEHAPDGKYWKAFVGAWRFVQQHMIDHERGGWRPNLTRIGRPVGDRHKSGNWKACYHTTRALLNCVDGLGAECPNAER